VTFTLVPTIGTATTTRNIKLKAANTRLATSKIENVFLSLLLLAKFFVILITLTIFTQIFLFQVNQSCAKNDKSENILHNVISFLNNSKRSSL
jgi:hypothetical protein